MLLRRQIMVETTQLIPTNPTRPHATMRQPHIEAIGLPLQRLRLLHDGLNNPTAIHHAPGN